MHHCLANHPPPRLSSFPAAHTNIHKFKSGPSECNLYPHCVIKDMLLPERFQALREEMISNLSSTFKETDLYKVYQTGDLGNLDPNDADTVRTIK